MKDYIHKEFPKSCDPNDFFGQVKRTVNGKPVGKEQINIIIDSICKGLDLNKQDVLFDLGCGNGALSVLIFHKIKAYFGIDFSEYLIEIAKKNFEKGNYTFQCAEANEFLSKEALNKKYTKGLCYGVFSYFEKESAERILRNIHDKYENINKFYIGNIPDRERASNFFYKDIEYANLLDDNQSSLGIWWSQKDFENLANKTGWKVEFLNMQDDFYSAHYRFDVVLTKKVN
ncbi:class I SAM-dependent methyltransferase [Flavobacteriaceae bacterium S0825]|uniref:class I SAM-dependent methyltransferase n=1 Tax=Gaetbulibacter sp. S0825 TaxID=2720084 RepID=UPI0014305D34|nr:class I SAM-dependent methyltransferase [Gaetbulibacter sp. S0825]MCK0109018.1 class I SAM-dependent methyltransferase [Flavobacteriaceae bacterium S0825]NIX64653.1 class I SAM-dependent methyltransferase [Gaetbulibacter sp. S0825]